MALNVHFSIEKVLRKVALKTLIPVLSYEVRWMKATDGQTDKRNTRFPFVATPEQKKAVSFRFRYTKNNREWGGGEGTVNLGLLRNTFVCNFRSVIHKTASSFQPASETTWIPACNK
jgi:hypothetical protein